MRNRSLRIVMTSLALALVAGPSYSQVSDAANSISQKEISSATTAAWVSAASAAFVVLFSLFGAIGGLVIRPFRKVFDRLEKLEEKLSDVALDVDRLKRDLPHFDKRISDLEPPQRVVACPIKKGGRDAEPC